MAFIGIVRSEAAREDLNLHFGTSRANSSISETYPDNGDIDMLIAMRVCQEVGQDGMVMPDHVPGIPGDVRGRQAFAFAFGSIQTALQMIGEHA
jgi:mannonate dehydratase